MGNFCVLYLPGGCQAWWGKVVEGGSGAKAVDHQGNLSYSALLSKRA